MGKNTNSNENVKKPNKQKQSNGKNKKNIKDKKVWKKILIVIIILIIIGAGVCAGLIFGLVGGKYAITKKDLIINYSNSTVYDQDGKVIAVLSATENRKILTKNEMGKYLPNAFVSIEDERFYKHQGVDVKRTGGAIATFLFNRGESSFGGSTITQQLVKNITNDKEDSGVAGAVRKIKEMARAHQVESMLSKDQILELYMNIIFLGGNVYGVGMASEYYFSKNASDLSLAESAFIAGVTHMPNAYNPFSEKPNTDIIKSRPKKVLKKMKELGYITEDEYNKAVSEVDEGLKFKKGKIDATSYSSHTEALVNQIIDQLVTEKGMDREYAKTYLYSGGFKIYSTEVSSVQDALEDEYSKSKYQVKTNVEKKVDGKTQKVKEAAQSAMVVIDHSNGYVVGTVGNLGDKGAFELNRATQSKRQPGSSIKPIGVYGPALQEGVINISSVYVDKPVTYGSWKPGNSYSGYKGPLNMRQAIKISSNTVAVQVLADLTPKKSIEYLKKLGISTLDEKRDNNLPLALGGISDGISPLEMAGAYATIANDGEYITPTFYIKVTDNEGTTILEPTQKKERVFSELTAYSLKELLTEPTKSGGTASNCTISGMDVGAKTGTTNAKKDKWLCGFTPYYTAATWYGYDTPTEIPSGATSNANILWKNVMVKIHKNLKSKKFEKPKGMTAATVCKDSGLLATDLCKSDPRGNRTYTEYFAKGTAPKKTCDCHVQVEICKKSNKLAGEFCTEKEMKVFLTDSKDKDDSKYKVPTDKCDICKDTPSEPKITLNGPANINLTVGEAYTEQGAEATDAKDGNLKEKIKIEGKVDTSKPGTYTITYTITNSSGKTAKITRTVKVTEKHNNTNENTSGGNE